MWYMLAQLFKQPIVCLSLINTCSNWWKTDVNKILLSVSIKSFSKGWLFSTAASVENGCISTSSLPFLPLGLTTSSCMVCNSAVKVSAHSSSSLGVAVVEEGFFFFLTFFFGVSLPFVSLDIRLALLPVTSFSKMHYYSHNDVYM